MALPDRSSFSMACLWNPQPPSAASPICSTPPALPASASPAASPAKNLQISYAHSWKPGPKALPLGERLEKYFGKKLASGVRVNEIRFVAEDAGYSEARMAAQLTAKTLGADANAIQDWFRSPEKMIQLIAAAEGSHGGDAGSGTGTGTGDGIGGVPGTNYSGAGINASSGGSDATGAPTSGTGTGVGGAGSEAAAANSERRTPDSPSASTAADAVVPQRSSRSKKPRCTACCACSCNSAKPLTRKIADQLEPGDLAAKTRVASAKRANDPAPGARNRRRQIAFREIGRSHAPAARRRILPFVSRSTVFSAAKCASMPFAKCSNAWATNSKRFESS